MNISTKASSILKLWAIALLLALATFALYWPAINHEFIHFFDDNLYVTECPHVQQGLSWGNVLWALQTFDAGNWHPVTWISHMLDFQLYGWNAHGHHFTSVLLNAINTALVFIWLRLMTGSLWRSAMVAALFGCHPLHVESVAWVAERKDMLNGLFGLMSLIFYTRYVQSRAPVLRLVKKREIWVNPTAGFLSSPFYWLALLFFVLGLMSKAMLVTWPFVLLLVDFWPLRRFDPRSFNKASAIPNTQSRWLRLMVEKVPFFLITAGVSVATFVAQKKGGAMDSLQQLALTARLENGLISYSRYLGKLFWPSDLAVFYPHPGHWPLMQVALAGAFLLGLTLLFLVWWRCRPWLLMGWLWFLGTLVPVIGLVQAGSQSMADRYTYLPSLGIFLAVVWGAGEFVQKWGASRPMLTAAGISLILSCCGVTCLQLKMWRDTETLFTHAVEVTGNSDIAQNNLACELFNLRRYDEAVPHYLAALRFTPGYILARVNLGNTYLKQGRIKEAAEQFREVLRQAPAHEQAKNNLNIALQAEVDFEAKLQKIPAAPESKLFRALALDSIASVLMQQGRQDEAIMHLYQAIRLNPEMGEAHGYLGVAYLNKGRMAEALRELQESVRLDPSDFQMRNNLGVACGHLGRIEEAMAQYREAIRLKPEFYLPHSNLGNALYKIGRRDEAIVQYREALRLNPDYAEAKENLARLLANKPMIGDR